jgi:hypothetical protein
VPPQTPLGRMRSAESETVARPGKRVRRDHQLNLSLTKDEYIAAYWRADRAGMRLVDYGRWCLLGGKDQPAQLEAAASTGDHLLFAELKRLGNNLNQLVRFCHSTGRQPPAQLDPLLQLIRSLINRGIGA